LGLQLAAALGQGWSWNAHPVVSSANESATGKTTVEGTLNSNPNPTFEVPLFSRENLGYTLVPILFLVPLFTRVRGREQRVEKLLRALLGIRFRSRIRRFRSVLALFSGSLDRRSRRHLLLQQAGVFSEVGTAERRLYVDLGELYEHPAYSQPPSGGFLS
jgi:hypothetical protein